MYCAIVVTSAGIEDYNSMGATSANLCGVSLATAPGMACYIPLGHVHEGEGGLQLDAPTDMTQIPMDAAIARLKPLLEDPSVLKVAQNAKYDLAVLARYGIQVWPIEDTMLIKAARNWECFDAIIESLKKLEADETLLVQSGKPVGVVRTHADAPRVMIANSNLVPHWATQEHFDDLCARGLMMYGQMTAGSWIYIGTQGILQGTYETFAECARQHFGGTLKGTLNVTAGCGGMGGAQPLAITMCDGTALVADVCVERLEKRKHDRYLDEVYEDLDVAIDRAMELRKTRRSSHAAGRSWHNAVDLLQRACTTRGIVPETLTRSDQCARSAGGLLPRWNDPREISRPRAADQLITKTLTMASMGPCYAPAPSIYSRRLLPDSSNFHRHGWSGDQRHSRPRTMPNARRWT